MAPPPQAPTQAGKFKPRKPAKKIRPGAGQGQQHQGQPQPDGAPSNASAAAVPIAVPSNASATGGRGQRGGRDGRGRGAGRGRGRFVVPQGQAFFTAAAPLSSASSARAAASSSLAARRARVMGTDRNSTIQSSTQQQEEIVGTLDSHGAIPDGVDSSATTRKSATELTVNDNEMSLLEREMMGGDSSGGGGGGGATMGRIYKEGYFSDSDSSRDDDDDKNNNNKPKQAPRHHTQEIEPLEPSFAPKQQHPLPRANKNQASSIFISTKNDDGDTDTDSKQKPVYLIQFPTRLPPLKEQAAPKDDGTTAMADDTNNADVQLVQTEQTNNTSTASAKASTPPCDANAFDHVLHKAVAGKVGKLQIFKSGKMRLVLEQNDDNGNPITMIVNQGLEHSFRQEAIAIDLENAQYKTVGTVQKTLVVTPDLS